MVRGSVATMFASSSIFGPRWSMTLSGDKQLTRLSELANICLEGSCFSQVNHLQRHLKLHAFRLYPRSESIDVVGVNVQPDCAHRPPKDTLAAGPLSDALEHAS